MVLTGFVLTAIKILQLGDTSTIPKEAQDANTVVMKSWRKAFERSSSCTLKAQTHCALRRYIIISLPNEWVTETD
jgi:hypothetical protein